MPLDPEIAATWKRRRGCRRARRWISPPRASACARRPRSPVHRLRWPRVENMILAGYLRARQYWPSEDAKLPLLVYFHGGRFISGDLESHDPICRMLAIAAGCRLLAVDYRLAPEHRFPAAAEDASLALEWALGQGTRSPWRGIARAPIWPPAPRSPTAECAALPALDLPDDRRHVRTSSYRSSPKATGRAPPTCSEAGASTCPRARIRAIRWHRRSSPAISKVRRRPGAHRRVRHAARRRRGLRAPAGRQVDSLSRHDPRLLHHAGDLRVRADAIDDAAAFLKAHW